MNRKNIRDFQIKTLTLFLILFFPVMLNAKNIDIGTSGDAINILGSNLCLNSTCISSWNDTGGAWLTNGLSVYYNSGNVGIGTSAPQGALDIASTEGFRTMGPVVFGGSLYVGSGNRLLTVDNTGNVFASTITEAVGLPATSLAGQTLRSNGTGWLADSNLFNNGTTVGIGTTNPDPLFKLDVAGNIILSNGGSSILTSSSELYLNPNMGEGALVLNAANGVFFNDADLFPDAFSGNRAKIGSNTQRFSGLYTDVITDNGTNLGIGKTNPAFKLDVVGGGQFTNTVFGVTPGGTEPLALATVEYVDAVAGGGGAGSGLWGGTLDGNIWNGTAGAGNVGIGVTNPESSLHVAGRMILDDGGYNMYLGGLAGVSDDLSANYNVGIGFSSMQNNVAGDYNLAIGGNALSSNISGSMNIAIGSSALMNSTQSDNVAVGVGALGDLSSGSYNVAIGSGAGMFHQSGTLTTSNWSVFIGGETQALENGGFGEIVIGYGATGAGSQSVTIGNFSNKKIILTGNVGIGTTAPSNKLHVVGGGQFTNTVFGVTPGGTEPLALATVEYVDAVAGGGGGGSGLWGGALDGNIWNGTAGAGNVGIGTTAPTSKLQVLGSISINEGSSYLYDTVPALKLAKGTDGVFVNTYVGNYAGAGASTRQTAIGYRAGVSNTGSYQTVVGHGSGLNNTGTGQTALGYEAGDTNTANYQTAVGYRAGDTNSGVGQSAFGYNAGFSNIGAEQTALGYHAGFNNTGYQQTAIGASAGVANGGEYVALVGSSAGHSNTGDRVVGLGAYAGFENIGHNQVAIGYEAGSQNEANNQIAIGFSAGSLNAGMWQVAIGDYAGHLNTGSYQVAVGKEAGSMNTGSRVIGIGASSSDNNSGNDVVAIGFLAGQFNSTSNQFILQQANINATPLIQGNFLSGNVGIGITNPNNKLHVAGGARFGGVALGVTPGGTEPLALATVEYVDGSLSGEYLPLAGGTMSGDLNMGGNDILNINKLTVVTVDPLYRIKGVNYSSFAPSVVGGVKEEYVARVKIDRLNSEGEYEKVIDFSKQQEGSDLWVWRKTVDFSEDNVEVLMTSYGKFAKMYYIIDGERIILRADNPVTVSYRLIGHRLDWKKWPTRATDQNETPGFIID